MVKNKEKSGQVWVETVIYTLIALTVIGLFLAFARPEIEEIQDKAVIEQSITMLEDVNSIILSTVQGGAGNQRVIELSIKKGSLRIDAPSNLLVFEVEGRYEYSEPGIDVTVGNIVARTESVGRLSRVTLISNYSMYNITDQNKEDIKTIGKSPTPYTLTIQNKGVIGGKNVIDISAK
jgi:hypothetical protein